MQGLRVQDGANGIQLVGARAHRDGQVGGNRSMMRMPLHCLIKALVKVYTSRQRKNKRWNMRWSGSGTRGLKLLAALSHATCSPKSHLEPAHAPTNYVCSLTRSAAHEPPRRTRSQ